MFTTRSRRLRVAVAPFFNLTADATLDGRQVAIAYFNELQLVQGFEVVPVGVVEATIREHHIALASPADARRVAQILQVDAIVIGAVTDFSAYYPPRCGLQVEWYSANPGFHPIPPGYGLPWGTHEEQDIPGPLVFEAEFALAREQLKTQTPSYEPIPPMPAQGTAKDTVPKGESSKTTAPSHAASATTPADNTAKASANSPPMPRLPSSEMFPPARRPVGQIRGALFRRRPAGSRRFVGPARPRSSVTRGSITGTMRISPRPWKAITTSATMLALTAGKDICNVATISSASAVICTSGRCLPPVVEPVKRE